jgi:hypothetical protein
MQSPGSPIAAMATVYMHYEKALKLLDRNLYANAL